MSWYDDERVRVIVNYVRWRRNRDEIAVSPGPKSELSGEMFGEFRMLLDAQLLTTPEFDASWRELSSDGQTVEATIVEGVLREISRDLTSLVLRFPTDQSLFGIKRDVDCLIESAR